MRYAGQRAVVVGASGGIGRAISAELLEHGADVALTYRTNRIEAERLVAHGAELQRRCAAYALDVCDARAIAECCNALRSEFGVPTILVNCAGRIRDRALVNMEPDDWHEVIAVNLTGSFDVIRQLAPLMIRGGGGRILNISSVSGLFGQAGQVNYSAAKGGVNALTRALARELGPFNITVNAIAPGPVETEMTGSLSDLHRRRLLERIPLRRFATPADIVAAARLFLAADGAYITGQVLAVDGGLTA